MNSKLIVLLTLTLAVVGCVTTPRYVAQGEEDQAASFRAGNKQGGSEIKVKRGEPRKQERTNQVLGLIDESQQNAALHEKAMAAIEQDAVLAPMSARADGTYPVVLINRNRSQERTIIYWFYGPSTPEYEVVLAPKSQAVVYLRSGLYYFKVLDRNGRLLKLERQVEINRLTGDAYRYAPSEINEIEVPRPYVCGDVLYQGRISVD